MPGVVTRTGVSDSYGRFVEVSHAGGLVSFYAHLKSAAAHMRPGHIVAGRDVVGYVGDTGHSTGPHLHFEIRKNGAPLNPAVFMDRQFMTAASLPIRKAAAVGRLVRIAQVSGAPRAHRFTAADRSRHDGRVHAIIRRASAEEAGAETQRPPQPEADAPRIEVGAYHSAVVAGL
jgi:hypothetical protein